MAYAPPTTVEAQPRTALPFGLFSVLTPRTAGDAHWQNGIEWETLTCEPASGIADPSCDPAVPTAGLPKVFEGAGLIGEASPFIVYGTYSCTPIGHSMEYAQQRATEHLLAREEARVEQALQTGDLGNGGFAPDATSVGTGLDIAQAVGALESWIGREYGSLGVIHMTRAAATVAAAAQVVIVRGSGLYTVLGTPVVAGAGYTGADPAGTDPAAGTTNIYATPALLGYRSEPFAGTEPASAGFNRGTNDLFAVSERTYVIGYDPCGSAVAGAAL